MDHRLGMISPSEYEAAHYADPETTSRLITGQQSTGGKVGTV